MVYPDLTMLTKRGRVSFSVGLKYLMPT